jgi:hypothetical protein
MYKNKFFHLVFIALVCVQFATSQNNTNSPFTRFGYGDINETTSGDQRAMGGISLGARSHFNINTVNPASYSSVDSMTFMFDIGTAVLGSRFSDQSGTRKTFNANLEYVTMQFPLSKGVGFSAGILPYSFTGYNFSTSHTAITQELDTIGYTKNFNGTGGFSQIYAGISADLFKHISLGVNTYYMYGNMINYRNVNYGSRSGFTSTTQTNSITARNFRFRFGTQFYNTFAKKHDVTLGIIYEQKAKLNGDFSQTTTSVLTETPSNSYDFELPTVYGLGLYYTYNKKLSVGLDYSTQQWKDAKYFGKTDSLSNKSKIALGIEYIPNIIGRKFSDRVRYRAGVNVNDAYYKVDGAIPTKNIGVSFGVGIPLRNSNTVINASFEYGKIGGTKISGTSTNRLNEDYVKFTFNAVFNEHWFFKRKL